MLDITLHVVIAALLAGQLSTFDVGVELFLVNLHIHLFEENAVGRDALTFAEKDDVTDHKVPVVNLLSRTAVATDNIDRVLLDLLLEHQELLLLAPVAERLNDASEEDSEGDGDRVNERDLIREET